LGKRPSVYARAKTAKNYILSVGLERIYIAHYAMLLSPDRRFDAGNFEYEIKQ